jgi:hypothetical protein
MLVAWLSLIVTGVSIPAFADKIYSSLNNTGFDHKRTTYV